MMPGPNLSGPTSATAEPLERVGLRKGITPPKVKCRYVSIGCCCMARTYGQQFDLGDWCVNMENTYIYTLSLPHCIIFDKQ
jgi:hypothetical protein